ncbi:T9SS C-terminal target domain-containing protein [Chryseobacterium carnipullorum]|uniref:Por secretion system C-terminal sorting domain n=1 Tax=Chryseobacterium carnipullorum TaxID=1124835 RepID=A0A1M7MBS7_CHRCU|nr:T9SS-dependent M36 family metallopeptidase [Chryseobacterium carnipullorum]AZA48180.1 T9SS C-terminal target domain-containing protein [Chryseobacterium carnipullorum]AZA67487.1 T9SS C-terminal target domain-containing protein [Chryseobacterium carnipullorum]SHM88183.1 Por secretion system C-terminal sorting domain-containing protein [Chryseobacterium carnipullorum]STD14460.1 Por secretion system C-terminal sorting domain [Chryseobacterium carnipullorum]
MKRIRLSVKFLLLCSFFGYSALSAQKHEQVIKDYVNAEKTFQRINPELKAFTIVNVDPSKSLKGDVVGIQQTINGVPVFGSSANVLVREDKVLSFADTFVKTYPSLIKGKESAHKESLVAEAARKLNGLTTVKNSQGKEESLKTKLVYFSKGGELILGYQFDLEEKGTGNLWTLIISTDDGSVLYRENLTISCDFHDGAHEHFPTELPKTELNIQPSILPVSVKQENSNLNKNFVLAPDNASYNVLPFPVEAPSFGSRALLNNPWDLTASPEGWHSDGTNHYTNTRGNNAYAYTDENNTNTVQFSADGGAARAFDFPMDVTLPPQNYTSAAVTNLFYVNNKMHDVFYKFGFTETARNFQTTNFSGSGAGNDAVLAEARDGGAYNNANFQSPADGSAPRMQMYLFEPTQMQNLFYNSPSIYTARVPINRTAQFGPALEGNAPVTGNLALSVPADACTAVAAGSLTGKIAVVTAATCGFAVKTKNLQNAGAIGVIQYHPNSDTPVGLGGTDATITIPTIMIGKTEGQFLQSEITNGATISATLKYDKLNYVYKDGSLDNGVMAHEYGHGITNRMTGTGNNCLNYGTSNEQMGEGWSDFFALMLTNKPGDNASVPRGMATFTASQTTNGAGIRPAKYSPDFTVNNYTYARTNGMKVNDNVRLTNGTVIPVTRADVHSIGFVWATMLWDLNWKYVEKYGYNSNVLADPNSGSARVLQLVVDALKLQQCNPNFIQGRNAILAADMAKTNGADKCMIWKVFAKRGLGVNAAPGGLVGIWQDYNQPAPDLSDQVENFDVPAECNTLAVNEASAASKGISIYPNPVQTEFTIKTPSGMDLSGITTVSVYDLTGKLVSSEKINLNKQTTVNVNTLLNGVYMVTIKGNAIDYSQKIIVSK